MQKMRFMENAIMKDYLLTNEFYAGAEDAAREKCLLLFLMILN